MLSPVRLDRLRGDSFDSDVNVGPLEYRKLFNQIRQNSADDSKMVKEEKSERKRNKRRKIRKSKQTISVAQLPVYLPLSNVIALYI